MKLTTLRKLFMAKPPLPIPYPCGSTKAGCAEITTSILRLASQKGLNVGGLENIPIVLDHDSHGTYEALLVSFSYQYTPIPMNIYARGYGTSRIEALKDLYDSMLETTCPTP